jgi:hypothetical protein
MIRQSRANHATGCRPAPWRWGASGSQVSTTSLRRSPSSKATHRDHTRRGSLRARESEVECRRGDCFSRLRCERTGITIEKVASGSYQLLSVQSVSKSSRTSSASMYAWLLAPKQYWSQTVIVWWPKLYRRSPVAAHSLWMRYWPRQSARAGLRRPCSQAAAHHRENL